MNIVNGLYERITDFENILEATKGKSYDVPWVYYIYKDTYLPLSDLFYPDEYSILRDFFYNFVLFAR